MSASQHHPTDMRSRLRRWTRSAVIISILLHVAFGISAIYVIALRITKKPQSQFVSEPPLRPILDPRKLEMKVKVQDLQKASARPRLQPRLVAQAVTDMPLPEIKTVTPEPQQRIQRQFSVIGQPGLGQGIGGGLGSGFGGGSGIGMRLPPSLAGRCSPAERSRRLAENGGKMQSQQAVMRALRWLKANQNPDGSWGDNAFGGMTGLALLAFLGHCETPDSKEFGETVTKAINYLLRIGQQNRGRLTPHSRGNGWAYEHGIATYALAEAYTMTQAPHLPPVLDMAARIIIDGQSPDGGWVYGFARSTPGDTSVSGWQIQALKAIHVSGLQIEGLEACLDKSLRNLLRVQKDNGTFGYRTADQGRWGLTGVGVLGFQLWKNPSHRAVRTGIDAILKRGAKEPLTLDYGKDANLYGWYYNTLACFMRGGTAWNQWNHLMQDELINNQNKDGSWPAVGGQPQTGSLKYQGGGNSRDAVVYRTALCTLMLEVYYRYLPSTS
jgi:hypothetical protein